MHRPMGEAVARSTLEGAVDGVLPAASAVKRVLVVDDSRSQRGFLSNLLASWGYDVVSVGSGKAALEQCHDVDLVLCDWIMPGMTGLALCREIRGQTRGRYVYFILLTVTYESAAVAHGLSTGADDILLKPVNPAELRARIAACERVLRIERELSEKNRVLTAALDELRAVQAALDRDLAEARKLQASLLPVRELHVGSLAISMMMQPAGHVGGDLVGQVPAAGARHGFFALDVSGHGMAPALLTARLAGMLGTGGAERGGAAPARDPAEIARNLNDMLLTDPGNEHYLTLLLAFADPESGVVDLLQAGHPHPLLRRAGGRIETIAGGGMPVGLFAEPAFGRVRVTLAPGDKLLIVSDGVTECAAPSGEMLDEPGLRRILAETAGRAGPAVFDALTERLAAVAGPNGPSDDVSAILIERDAS